MVEFLAELLRLDFIEDLGVGLATFSLLTLGLLLELLLSEGYLADGCLEVDCFLSEKDPSFWFLRRSSASDYMSLKRSGIILCSFL